RDAISVFEELGERYLWVDALCITQDSSNDRRIQVLRMRQIYASAKCTIAAASSVAAKEGLLPKTKVPSAGECQSEAELDQLLDKAPWSTRGWCYQEKVLSHRMIFFTTSRIYLQCQEGTFNSRGALLPPSPSGSVGKFNKVGAMLPTSSDDDDLEAYVSAVEYFSQRKVTMKDDKMNAFQGVLQRYSKTMNGQASAFSFRLPVFAFDQTFCWRTTFHAPDARNDSFPSWSWLGWDVPVTFERDLVRHARTNQMIYGEHGTDNYQGSLKVRKPARDSMFMSESGFGFPASGNGQFYNAPERHMVASVADLRIDKDAINSNGSNGLYAVYDMRCSQQPPPPRNVEPPKTMTLLDLLSQPMPEIKWMDDETAAAPSVPAKKQTSEEYDVGEHADHQGCEAHVPISHIWLDKAWRGALPDHCVMEFMALHGEKEEKGGVGDASVTEDEDGTDQGNEKWTTTMLMLMQRMEKKGHWWASERVQVMDCSLTEEEWASTGAGVKSLKMV
ncbi:HET domain-containing protein, partial [Candidatus Bathyarchaeota archaeon]|nr:HET domain-containing protein [Candidatus Bathyarchaeota archaeon]